MGSWVSHDRFRPPYWATLALLALSGLLVVLIGAYVYLGMTEVGGEYTEARYRAGRGGPSASSASTTRQVGGTEGTSSGEIADLDASEELGGDLRAMAGSGAGTTRPDAQSIGTGETDTQADAETGETDAVDTSVVDTTRMKRARPIARAETVYTTVAQPTFPIQVLANDDAPDGAGLDAWALDTMDVVIQSEPNHGSVTITDRGGITYSPSDGFSGTDAFTYALDPESGVRSNPATVTVRVRRSASGDSLPKGDMSPNKRTVSGNAPSGDKTESAFPPALAEAWDSCAPHPRYRIQFIESTNMSEIEEAKESLEEEGAGNLIIKTMDSGARASVFHSWYYQSYEHGNETPNFVSPEELSRKITELERKGYNVKAVCLSTRMPEQARAGDDLFRSEAH